MGRVVRKFARLLLCERILMTSYENKGENS